MRANLAAALWAFHVIRQMRVAQLGPGAQSKLAVHNRQPWTNHDKSTTVPVAIPCPAKERHFKRIQKDPLPAIAQMRLGSWLCCRFAECCSTTKTTMFMYRITEISEIYQAVAIFSTHAKQSKWIAIDSISVLLWIWALRRRCQGAE